MLLKDTFQRLITDFVYLLVYFYFGTNNGEQYAIHIL